jgi:hypothetical protein
MSRKIFISYRRGDSAASALSIAQYLEHAFGRNNVFIDVDMRAGAKFPEVLEARLAECKVMLVLIGPGWLEAKDEHGRHRLESADDWVRLEISRALKRNIAVIPVLISGAELPPRAALPEELHGLVDHQGTSVSHSSFRHDMSGLVRDIRSIPHPMAWRKPAAIAAAVVLLIGGGILASTFNWTGMYNGRSIGISIRKDEHRIVPTGEWVLFAVTDQNPAVPYFFHPHSVETLPGAVVYRSRAILKTDNPAEQSAAIQLPEPSYQEERSIIDCVAAKHAVLERTVYNQFGEVLSRFSFGDSQKALSNAVPIKSGQITYSAMILLCGDLRVPVLAKDEIGKLTLSYVARSPHADGDIFYQPVEGKDDKQQNQPAMLLLVKYDRDTPLSGIISRTDKIGVSQLVRFWAYRSQVSCSDRRISSPRKIDYFDSQGDWVAAQASSTAGILIEPAPDSLNAQLLILMCDKARAQFGGTYEGVNYTRYKHGPLGEQKISVIIEHKGDQVKSAFRTVLGEHGSGKGTLTGNRIDQMTLKSGEGTSCPADYQAAIEFADDSVKWSFKGNELLRSNGRARYSNKGQPPNRLVGEC